MISQERPELKKLEHYADRLPPIEVTIGRLVLAGKTQRQIADQLHVHQPAISYRIKSLCRRIAEFETLPTIYASNFARDFCTTLDDTEIAILVDWWNCRSFIDIARRHQPIYERDISRIVHESIDKLAQTLHTSRSRLKLYVTALRQFERMRINANGNPQKWTYVHPRMKPNVK